MSKVEKTKKTVQKVEKALRAESIKHEPIEYTVFLFNASAYDVQTEHCTIDIEGDRIRVNEKDVDSIEDMIHAIRTVEG